MITSFIVSKRALLEMDKIYDYYEKSQIGLGEKFLTKVYLKYKQISTFPKSGVEKKRTYRETYL